LVAFLRFADQLGALEDGLASFLPTVSVVILESLSLVKKVAASCTYIATARLLGGRSASLTICPSIYFNHALRYELWIF